MSDPSVKSSSTCCARPEGAESTGRAQRSLAWGLSALLALAIFVPSALASLKKSIDPEELLNPLLGVEYTYWLVGPIYEMASEDEVAEFLDLVADDEAEAFVARFWESRNAGTKIFEDTPQDLFEQRAVEADKRYTEEVYPGRRSARGTVYILFGEPEEVSYESPRNVGDSVLEVWAYPRDAEPGLNEERPKRKFKFVEVDGRTERFTGQMPRQRRPRPRFDGRN